MAGLYTVQFFAVSISKSKVLPGLKIHAIDGSFQNPVPRPWGVGCLHYDISYLVNLENEQSLSYKDTWEIEEGGGGAVEFLSPVMKNQIT